MSNPTLAFYDMLLMYFGSSVPALSAATQAMEIYAQHGDSISLDDLTLEKLQQWHQELHNPEGGEDPGIEVMEQIAKSAFQDLADDICQEPVRVVIDNFKRMAGIPDDIFICATHRTDRGDRFAEFTIVTDNVNAFREFWEDPDRYIRMKGRVHYSEASGARDPE